MAFITKTVNSSSMRTVAYDAESRTLEIVFCSGRTYRYDQVPLEIANGLLAAKSKGGYFFDHIRGKFAYRCVDEIIEPFKETEDDASKRRALEKIASKASAARRQAI